ncbi:ABC transporter permease [Spongisporangium articulatum]|uniref:ABC transporter permease n=1 Tax=Spongisporangium articulatum TaxID=3362603 RepID=A0ABW8AJ49_9ACTN
MATVAATPAQGVRRPGRGALVVGVLLLWLVAATALAGRWTLPLAPADLTWLHERLNDLNDWVGLHRNSNPVFVYGLNQISDAVGGLITFLQHLVSVPVFPRPVPQVGWLGVVALMTLVAGAVGTWRTALLAAAGFVFLGLQGLWTESMDTLATTAGAVLICLVIGIPVGVWAGISPRFHRLLEPVLDFLQIMPSFVYLAPLTLLFLIGPASAAITTVIYAIAPVIRFTAHGIRTVPPTNVEAATSLGATRWQRLRTVQLPMAGHSIVLGINQTIMAALAMATITALIDAPGLGKTVLKALQTLDVGTSFNAGLAIVVLAIVLDRTVAAAGRRAEAARDRPAWAAAARPWVLSGGAVVAVVAVYLSRTYLWAAEFPTTVGGTDITVGSDIARYTGQVTDWIGLNASGVTGGIKNFVTLVSIDPLQDLLTSSPWFVVMAAVAGLALLLAGWRTALATVALLALLIGTGVWQDAMATLAATIVGALLVLALGVGFGVWMARSPAVDGLVRPVLDAAQVMPAFVYLVPFLALFSASRFTAIVAAVVYGAPVAIKVVADGVRAVSPSAVEASTAAGSTAWQQITKVQLPMAVPSLVLAVNQSICYVLSMVVVGGLVGAGALGYDVVSGFSQGQLFGKGLAAGLAIVLLGVLLNEITHAAARRERVG